MNTNTHTNVPFIVTKKISNANGFLLPSTLYDTVKNIAAIPVKGFYLQEVPEFTDYKFKMHKNAFVKDKLTIQAQLVKQTTNGYLVNILVTKPKNTLNHHERICSALFNFPVDNVQFNESKTAC
ncbi:MULTISPECIES: hypothetical protein [Aestuariibaculum]|uniref:Uncharacterized protein n=1 Tax=Aestuariibaculum lutulentum TaxID=2920935 RepID=A0ABS9REC2_9FLAO|nr:MULTISPECIES: hypothetical protein [Aestuariibaculum]MCH4551298.1 hypothetical protein [Aestuariibaculum lutulentum]MCR8666417.1 hypothetical protein [Aestuariibaculum sp. M13]